MRLMQLNQKVTSYCQILPVLDTNCSQIHLSQSLFRVFDLFFCTVSNQSLFTFRFNLQKYKSILTMHLNFLFFQTNVLQEI